MSTSTSTSTNSKARQAVANATGSGTVVQDGGADMAPMPKEQSQLFTRIPAKEREAALQEFIGDTESEFAPQIQSMEPGDLVRGILEGYGGSAEFKNDRGEMREVQTWILRLNGGNARISILSSAQLDTKLPPFIGSFVQILRGDDVKSKTNAAFRIANYMVKGERKPDGTWRSWGSAVPQLTGRTDQPALPAGSDLADGEDRTA